MSIVTVKLDGFTADGHGNVIGSAQDLTDGDVQRVTNGSDVFESRYYTRPAPPGPQPIVMSWGALAAYIIGLLGGGATGRAALGNIINACAASAQGGDRFFAVYFQGQTTFTKAEFTGVLADVAIGIVSNAQKTAVANGWPTA